MADETTNETEATTGLDMEAHLASIRQVIDQIRPALQNDGGDCELVEVSPDGKVVFLRLQGACQHCPSATYTIQFGIERVLKDLVPGVESVQQVH